MDRIVVGDPTFVTAHLTLAVNQHGMALALPQGVWRARQGRLAAVGDA